MIQIFHKMLVLLKTHLNYLKDNIFEFFFKKCNRQKINFFSKYIMMENPKSEEEKIIKGMRNIFRLNKGPNRTAIKNIIYLLRPKKEVFKRKLKELKI